MPEVEVTTALSAEAASKCAFITANLWFAALLIVHTTVMLCGDTYKATLDSADVSSSHETGTGAMQLFYPPLPLPYDSVSDAIQ